MKPLILSDDARDCILHELQRGASLFGATAAETYISDLLSAVGEAASHEILQPRTADTLPGVTVEGARLFSYTSFKAHLVLYRPADTHVDVIAILRRERELNQLFSELVAQWSDVE